MTSKLTVSFGTVLAAGRTGRPAGRTQSPEVNPDFYGQLIFDKSVKAVRACSAFLTAVLHREGVHSLHHTETHGDGLTFSNNANQSVQTFSRLLSQFHQVL